MASLAKEKGKYYRVHWKFVVSAHADEHDLLRLLEAVRNETRRVFLVHGEANARARLTERLRKMGFTQVEAARPGQRFDL